MCRPVCVAIFNLLTTRSNNEGSWPGLLSYYLIPVVKRRNAAMINVTAGLIILLYCSLGSQTHTTITSSASSLWQARLAAKCWPDAQLDLLCNAGTYIQWHCPVIFPVTSSHWHLGPMCHWSTWVPHVSDLMSPGKSLNLNRQCRRRRTGGSWPDHSQIRHGRSTFPSSLSRD
jgi:hypothetical protein